MIIPERRRTMANGELLLSSWLRAPISLNHGCPYYIVYEKLHKNIASTELILTTISPSYWSDAWRVEIQTHDTPGVLAIIYEIFSRENIKVIAAEGSISTFNQLHTMSFVISAARYISSADGSTKDRYNTSKSRLLELEFLLKANLFEHVTLNPDNRPKIKVRRFETLRLLHRDAVVEQTRTVEANTGLLFLEDKIKLSGQYVEKLENIFQKKNINYTWHVDTKERVARGILFGGSSSPGHLQLSLGRQVSQSLRHIHRLVMERGGNIIKFQVRPGGNRLTLSDDFGRLDLTYLSHRSDLDVATLTNELVFCFSNDNFLAECGVRILDSADVTADGKSSTKTTLTAVSSGRAKPSKVFEMGQGEAAIKRLDNRLSGLESRYLKAKDLDNLREVRLKRDNLRPMAEELIRVRGDTSTLFVSLSKNYEKELRHIRPIAARHGFNNIVTGFDTEILEDDVRLGIFDKIASASAFLGIWTDDVGMQWPGSAMSNGPGVWMPLELGAALYGRKPFKLALKDNVSDRLLSPVGEKAHGHFHDQVSLHETVGFLIAALRTQLDKIGTR